MIDVLWRIELLGGLKMVQGDNIVTRFRTQKTASLLAYLALHTDRSHPREFLIELFWPDEPLEAGRNVFRVALNSLRKQLEPVGTPYGGILFADRNSIQLNPVACVTDVARFLQLLATARRETQPEDSIAALIQAVATYRGELLPGFYEDWVLTERERLSQLYLEALLELARRLRESGEFARAADYAQRAIQADPLREEAYRTLIQSYVQQGNPAAARQRYDQLVQTLRTELGASPSEETRALASRLLTTPAAAPSPTPPSRPATSEAAAPVATAPSPSAAPSPAPATSTLPFPFTRFFGREAECAHLRELLRPQATAPCQITLTGPGGTGKTRLAVETARSLAEDYAGSVYFVPLSEETDARRIVEAAAHALGLPRSVTGDYWGALTAALSAQPTLLILDGFEHLTAGGGPVVLSLLRSVPSLRLVITSRRSLEIPGEREIPVSPLPTPATLEQPEQMIAWPAVQLFQNRAQASKADFTITARNAPDLFAVCQALEGIPLALELAAARTRALSLAQMREQLTDLTSSTGRFELLSTRRADKPDRHRSLWATIAWSYDLLPPPLRHFFTQLSVFRGGWTLEAAQQVCEEPFAPEYLTQLRSHSLLLAEEGVPDLRFRMLDSLREFASEQLTQDERDALARRHVRYFLQMADDSRAGLRGSDQGLWLKRMDADNENLRSALAWCVAHSAQDEGATETGLRFMGSLGQYWQMRGPLRESAEMTRDLLNHAPCNDDPETRAAAYNTAGGLFLRMGDYTQAQEHFTPGLALYREVGDLAGVARILSNQGILYWSTGDLVAARAAQAESLDLRLQVGDRWGAAAGYLNLGSADRDMGNEAAAIRSFEQSLAISREIGDTRGIGSALLNLANMVYAIGDLPRARTLYEESLAITREQGNAQGEILALSNIGTVLYTLNDLDAATTYLEEALELGRKIGDDPLTGSVLIELGRTATAAQNYALARTRLRDSLTCSLSHIKVCVVLQAFGALQFHLGDATHAAQFYGAADALRTAYGTPVQSYQRQTLASEIDAIRAILSPETFAAMWAQGQTLSKEQAFELARRLGGSGK